MVNSVVTIPQGSPYWSTASQERERAMMGKCLCILFTFCKFDISQAINVTISSSLFHLCRR